MPRLSSGNERRVILGKCFTSAEPDESQASFKCLEEEEEEEEGGGLARSQI